jgi:ABC-type nitrate/sulfonate/bicarbonate transport system permease component
MKMMSAMPGPRHGGLPSAAVSWGFAASVLAAWQAAAWAGLLPPFVLGPWEITTAALQLPREEPVAQQAGLSLFRALSGFALGAGLGVVLGLLSGVSRTVRDLLDIPQAFVHAIPKISLFPAVALWLGFSDSARILVIALSCFFPAYLNALSGALGVPLRFVWLARNLQATRTQTFFQVVLPTSLPRTLVGVRISLMVAFILMVATEVVGHSEGLGAALMQAYMQGDYARMYAHIVYVALLGFGANALLQALSRRLTRGQALLEARHG